MVNSLKRMCRIENDWYNTYVTPSHSVPLPGMAVRWAKSVGQNLDDILIGRRRRPQQLFGEPLAFILLVVPRSLRGTNIFRGPHRNLNRSV